jgi:ribosomal protein S18 acetylase RimI-like enzyme
MGDFVVRPASPQDAAGIARVKIDAWRIAYAPFLDPVVLKALDVAKETGRWRERLADWDDDEPVWVAIDGENVLGFVIAGANRFPEVACDGELHAIYVHPDAQRRGVGQALVRTAVKFLVGRGFESMVVFVFRDNAIGTSFYRSLGAERCDGGEFEVGGKKYPDESYAWRSLSEFQDRLAQASVNGV